MVQDGKMVVRSLVDLTCEGCGAVFSKKGTEYPIGMTTCRCTCGVENYVVVEPADLDKNK